MNHLIGSGRESGGKVGECKVYNRAHSRLSEKEKEKRLQLTKLKSCCYCSRPFEEVEVVD